jgi:hypothetical protein
MLKLSTGHGQEICMEESTTKKWETMNKENVFRWKTQDLPLVPTSQLMVHSHTYRMQEIETN